MLDRTPLALTSLPKGAIFTDYKATNTPAGRDLLREILDAFRAEGLRTGLYYSLLDWHHPDFTIDGNHPLRDLPPEEIARLNSGRDMARYRAYMRNQVEELLTKYGPIDTIWFDFSYPTKAGDRLPGKGRDDWGSEELFALVRRLAPNAIVNNRLDRLAAYAEWMDANENAIRGCGAAPAEWTAPSGTAYTYDPERRRLYLHIFDWPYRHIHLHGLAGKIEYAQFTHDRSEVLRRENDGRPLSHIVSPVPADAVTLELPVVQPPVRVPVVELFLR